MWASGQNQWVFSFYFLFLFSFNKTNLFQNIFKTKFEFLFNLSAKTTHHNKSNVEACMLKQVASSYGKF